jgi:hypothetical protein
MSCLGTIYTSVLYPFAHDIVGAPTVTLGIVRKCLQLGGGITNKEERIAECFRPS